MRHIVTAVILVIAVILVASFAFAQPNKEQYELQERCGKKAESLFDKEYPNGAVRNTKDGQSISGFENHYSPELNKCFYLETITSMNYDATFKNMTFSVELWDANEHREYGRYFKRSNDKTPFECNVLGKACHSEQEWKELIKRFMGE